MFRPGIAYLFTIILCGLASHLFAQDQRIADSLQPIYASNSLTDSARLNLLLELSFDEVEDPESALRYAGELVSIASDKNMREFVRAGYFLKGTKLRVLGRLNEALEAFFKSAAIAKELHFIVSEADSYGGVASVYSVSGNHESSLEYYRKAIGLLGAQNKPYNLAGVLSNLGDEFLRQKEYDSALSYFREAADLFGANGYNSQSAYSIGSIGIVFAKIGKKDSAEFHLNEAIEVLEANHDYYPICEFLLGMSDLYLENHDYSAAIVYAKRSLNLAKRYRLPEQQRDAFLKLSTLYETTGDLVASITNLRNYISLKDSIEAKSSEQKMYNLRSKFEKAERDAEVDRAKSNLLFYQILAGVAILVVIIIVILGRKLSQNYRQKVEAYVLLDNQKKIIEQQRDTTQQTLSELKRTQAHLIHVEKMAALGQLAAGVAHEIQNPLNFVNNFSELNKELLQELTTHIDEGNLAEIKNVGQSLAVNEDKISIHGKRAEAIVTGMLQHSRTVSGEKRQVDVKQLLEEYGKLALQKFQAKHPNFQIAFANNIATTIPKMKIVPQEVGQVVLNLLSNSFYAVFQKSRNDPTYFPEVSLAAQNTNHHLKILVRDNGVGIPQNFLSKIFQPFFTTKDPNEGTGLGLSLAYDMVKVHGGEISVESKEEIGSVFTVSLPLNA